MNDKNMLQFKDCFIIRDYYFNFSVHQNQFSVLYLRKQNRKI